jgi:hypothetical protein
MARVICLLAGLLFIWSPQIAQAQESIMCQCYGEWHGWNDYRCHAPANQSQCTQDCEQQARQRYPDCQWVSIVVTPPTTPINPPPVGATPVATPVERTPVNPTPIANALHCVQVDASQYYRELSSRGKDEARKRLARCIDRELEKSVEVNESTADAACKKSLPRTAKVQHRYQHVSRSVPTLGMGTAITCEQDNDWQFATCTATTKVCTNWARTWAEKP